MLRRFYFAGTAHPLSPAARQRTASGPIVACALPYRSCQRPMRHCQTNQGEFMNIKRQIAACAAFVGLAVTSVAALADDHAYTEGPVVNVAAIRTEYGKFDDYMKYLDTTWKAEQEAAKKAGNIISYRGVTVEARGENDP